MRRRSSTPTDRPTPTGQTAATLLSLQSTLTLRRSVHSPYSQGPAEGFSSGGKTEGPKAESGVGVLVEGPQLSPPHQQGAHVIPLSNYPLPTSKGPMGPRCELPQRGSWRSPDRPKFSHYFQHCRMASPDTIILLIVDYHAAIGGQDPRVLLAYAAATAAGMYKNIHIKVKLT